MSKNKSPQEFKFTLYWGNGVVKKMNKVPDWICLKSSDYHIHIYKDGSIMINDQEINYKKELAKNE